MNTGAAARNPAAAGGLDPAAVGGLDIQSVTRIFRHPAGDVRAVDDVSLSIRGNEFFTLLGPSGCGKTTLLRLIAGLETADSGRIVLAGGDIAQLPPYLRPVNTVFQSYALFPHMTVAENIAFGLRMRKRPAAEIKNEIAAALALVRMEEQAARKPAELSGGQQQRVALARALVNRPKILLLDESLSALDYKLRKDMQLELKRLQRDTGITFVFVTHDQDEALSMSDRIAVMDKGKVAQLGSPQDIYHKPATRFVAGFIGICNFVKAASLGLSEAGDVGFRPEDASFAADFPHTRATSGSLYAAGTIGQVTYRGAVTHYQVALDAATGGEVVTVSADKPQGPKTGDKVTLDIAAERLIRCA